MLPTNEEVFAMCNLSPEEIAEITHAHVTPLNRDKEVAQPLLIDFIIDDSGTMRGLRETLRQEFNTTMLEGLRGVNARQTKVLRVGALRFATSRAHFWPGFRSLDELGKEPIQPEMYASPVLGDQTALHSGMICGLLWTQRCVQQIARDSKRANSRGIVIVLTDGANNEKPLETQAVAKLVKSVGSHITPYLAYFKTGEGLDEAGSIQLAASTGFNHMGYYDVTSKTSNQKERETNFRHFFNLFSRKVLVAAA